MIPCPFCGRYFQNKQALRAHLKHCPIRKLVELGYIDVETARSIFVQRKTALSN